jgi:hypothetical protein
MVRWFLMLAATLVLGSCAKTPKVVVPKPLIKSFAVVPATSPLVYTIDRRGSFGQVRAFSTTPALAANEKRLTAMLVSPQFSPGQNYTDAVATALRNRGYDVQVLGNIARNPEDPDDVDYAKLSYSADAVLHLYFDELGIYIQRSSRLYLPRLNASARLHVRGHPALLHDDSVYYGIDATPGKSWGIVADPRYAYRDVEFVIDNIESLREALAVRAQEVGKRIAERVDAAVK